MESLTDFEIRVTSWEQDAKETSSDLIKIGVVIKGLEKSGFRDHLLSKLLARHIGRNL